jgi:hypothetical protein
MLPFTWLVSQLQRITPVHIPAEYEGLLTIRQSTRCDDARTREALGIASRPWDTTMTDAVRWLHEAGHVTARQAGVAAVR